MRGKYQEMSEDGFKDYVDRRHPGIKTGQGLEAILKELGEWSDLVAQIEALELKSGASDEIVKLRNRLAELLRHTIDPPGNES